MRLARNTPYTTDYETPLCAAVRTSGANTSGAKLIHVGTAALRRPAERSSAVP